MTYRQRLFSIICIMSFFGVWSARAEDEGHVARHGSLEIEHPWVRAASQGGKTLVFMEIRNVGDRVRLTAVRTGVAERAAIVGIVMQGTELSTTDLGMIDVPPGETRLDPAGLAIELDGLSRELSPGESVEMVLAFEPGGEVTIHAEVEPADAHEHHHAGHSHD